jgi:2-iminobutanoate/2-iminopropanoate deaminase
MQLISTTNAPSPAGHYSQAVVHAGLVFVSGQLPVDPATRELFTGAIEEQTRRTLANVAAVLEAAGSDLQHILKATVYVSDIALWGKVDQVYAEVFGEHRPARAVVPTRDLHGGAEIEVECVAALRAS